MGALNKRDNMSRFHVLLVATLLAFAVSEFAPETELEEAYSPEEAHADAQQSIDALLQEGKKDSACRNLATGTKKEITDGQRNTQRLVNRMMLARTAIPPVWQHTTPPRAARPALATSTTPPTMPATAPRVPGFKSAPSRSRNSRWAALLSSTMASTSQQRGT